MHISGPPRLRPWNARSRNIIDQSSAPKSNSMKCYTYLVDDCDAIIVWTFGGNLFAHNIRRKWSSQPAQAKTRRCSRNWDGFLSPNYSCVINGRSFVSRDTDNRFISSDLIFKYLFSAGGSVMISLTSLAWIWSNCCNIVKKIVESQVIPDKMNCASTWANHNSGSSGQKGGRRTDTVYTIFSFSIRLYILIDMQ